MHIQGILLSKPDLLNKAYAQLKLKLLDEKEGSHEIDNRRFTHRG